MQRNDLLGVLVATFPSRACAEEAIRDLHRAGVRHTSLGVAKSAGEAVTPPAAATEIHERVEAVGIGHIVARWFRRERDETLYEALREHGVGEAAARRIDGAIADGYCLVVAEDVTAPAEAASIAMRHGGTVLVTADAIETPAVQNDPMVQTRVEAARRHPSRRHPVG